MMKKLHKLGLVKAIDDEQSTIESLVSTFDWDRMMERFDRGAWDLSNFRKNPVVLWGHEHGGFPIGKALEIREDDAGLVAVTQFDVESPRAMEVFRLFKAGFLNSFSVGFIPKRWRFEETEGMNGAKGLVFEAAELLEYSAVSVPANPGARATRETAELVTKVFGDNPPLLHIEGDGGGDKPYQVMPVPFPEEKFVPPEKHDPERKPEIEATVKQLLDLAKIAKTEKVDEKTLALLTQASQVFNEIISEHSKLVSREDFENLQASVDGLSKVVSKMFPDAGDQVKSILNQIDKALGARAA